MPAALLLCLVALLLSPCGVLSAPGDSISNGSGVQVKEAEFIVKLRATADQTSLGELQNTARLTLTPMRTFNRVLNGFALR